MQNVIERFVNIPQGGTINAGGHTLGSFDETDPNARFQLRKLRVAPLQPWTEKFTAMLTTPGSIQVGPIDIPFTINIELPVSIAITCPTACSNNQTIEMIVSDLPDSPNMYGATLLVQPRQNVDVAIPDAVVAVTPYPSTATLTFKNGGGATIATATGPLIVARPRLAKTVASNSATPAMLFHY
jgi:hypothetical protein